MRSPETESTSKANAMASQDMQGLDRLLADSRREIKMHCYRMMGSLHEAEDAVQEAFLRAWRSYRTFDGRGSFRAWLYRIATNVCFDALIRRRNGARVHAEQPDRGDSEIGDPPHGAGFEWSEPGAGASVAEIADAAPTPEARYDMAQATRQAFVAAIQQLVPRQRAVLLLCDVLGWSVAETAQLLGGSVASINSALQRARAKMSRQYPSGAPAEAARPTTAEQQLLRSYLSAWDERDADQLAALLKADVGFAVTQAPQRQLQEAFAT